jgi:hypothetical protein
MTYVREHTVTLTTFVNLTGCTFASQDEAYRHQAAWFVSIGDSRRGRRVQLDRRVARLARLLKQWSR